MSRKDFLSLSAVAGVSTLVGSTTLMTSCGEKAPEYTPLKQLEGAYIPVLNDKADDGKELKAGVIGCGGRGSGAIVDLLNAANGIKVVALGDTFADRLQNLKKNLAEKHNQVVADENCFVGFDAYKKVIDSGVDMVVIATPPSFRPIHFQYATEKGVHSFLEKPIAVDPKGYRMIMATAKQAQAKGLSVVTGTQRHHQRPYVEAFQKIQEGMIGEITGGNVYWNQSQLWFRNRDKAWTDTECMIRDWVNWKWLSGDHIVEQHVHNIDVFLWMSGLKPVKATAFGGRHRRVTGDQYDMFSVDFEMENGIHLHSMCRQINGCANNVGEFIQGTKGSWNSYTHEIKDLAGNVVWKYDEEAAKAQYQQHNPYVLEHVDWVNHIRKGTAHDEATQCAISCLAAVMGRESAYSGASVTWDEASKSAQDYMAEFKHEYGKQDMDKCVVMVPGK